MENKLKSYLVRDGITVPTLAKYLGICVATLYKKMHDSTFTQREMKCIAKVLKLSDREFLDIFFAD